MVLLRLEGLRGKNSTPSVGWEVLVKSHLSEAGAARSAWDNDSELSPWTTVRMLLFCMVDYY
jgi:hypothetical protein